MLAGLLLLVVAVVAAWSYVTRTNLSSVERGRRLAEKYGCLGCHGPDGGSGVFNPGRVDITVPSWKGDLMMYAKDTAQIRQWIQNGVTDTKSQSQSWKEQRDKGALKMPAYGKVLAPEQIDDLVTFVMFTNGQLLPEDSLARQGYSRADSLGCFGCHGAGGWLSRPNPRSFKGYVASWATDDFADLVHNRAEFDEWITTSISSRLKGNSLASYFFHRSTLRMPAYRDHLHTGDLDALWQYIQWLRSKAQQPH